MVWGITIVGALLVSAGMARAQPTVSDLEVEARQRFVHGCDLAEAGDHRAALAEFQASYAVRPVSVVLLSIARMQQALGLHADAAETLQRYVGQAELTLAERRELQAQVRQLRDTIGELTVRLVPLDASLLVDGQLQPTGQSLRLTAGPHEIEVRRDGFDPVRRQIEITPGQPREMLVRLNRVRRRSWLSVDSHPRGARVRIDGETVGRTAWSGEVAPGGHLVEIDGDGYQAVDREVVVLPDDEHAVREVLARNVSLLERWWFWVAVAGAAAGVGVVVALATHDPAAAPAAGTLATWESP